MPSQAQAEREYYKSLLPNSVNTSLADLKAEFFQGLAGGSLSTVPSATTTVSGTVRRMVTVPQQAALTVTDIATAQTAVNALTAKVNALITAAQTARQMV